MALIGDEREEAFDLVEPGSIRRDEVYVPARVACQPDLCLRVPARGVMVDMQ
jgi:hypothetical protein